jgi:hypothetical protein
LGSFNLARRDGDPISLDQWLVIGGRLPVHSDQVVFRLGVGAAQGEELAQCELSIDFNLVSETSTVVVDKENVHTSFLLGERET